MYLCLFVSDASLYWSPSSRVEDAFSSSAGKRAKQSGYIRFGKRSGDGATGGGGGGGGEEEDEVRLVPEMSMREQVIGTTRTGRRKKGKPDGF